MGACQSYSERKKGDDGFYVDNGIVLVAKDKSIRLAQSIISPSGGKNSSASFAYDLSLISPSEKTHVTDALSPMSAYSLPLSKPLDEKENHSDFAIDVDDENENFASDEKLEPVCLSEDIIAQTCSQPGCNGIGEEDNDRFNDEHSHDLDKHQSRDPLTKRAEKFTEHFQNVQNGIHGRRKLHNFICTTFVDTNHFHSKGKRSDCPNSPRKTKQRLMERPIQSIVQPNQETNESHVSSKLGNGTRYNSTPPLLAPPKDTTVVTQPSNTETSVKPAIITTFNKMKTKVEQIHKQQKLLRQEKKIKDRRDDIQGYKKLWEEFNGIKKRVIKQHTKNATSLCPKNGGQKVSLKDSTTWFVDFSALDSMNHSDDNVVKNNSEATHNENQEKQTSTSLLIENDTFRMEEVQQQKTLRSHSAGGNVVSTSPSSHMGIHESPTTSHNDHDNDKRESGSMNNTYVTLDLDSENRSIISDLDNGSNSSMTLENDRAFVNDDYGVLNRYSRKLMESTVPTHTENFNAQINDMGLQHQILEDANASLSVPKSLNEKNASLSFSKYLAENCLPSVCIENAETGLVRWRKFPMNDVEVPAARRIDFSHSENGST